MSERKENLKRTLGITEYPWSSDDEEMDVETPFRRPNEESDVSNETNEEQRGIISPVWEDEQSIKRVAEQLLALENDSNRAIRQDAQRSRNSRNYENIECYPNNASHRIVVYKRLQRRDGSTFRNAFVASSNVARVRHAARGCLSLSMLTGANIAALVRERQDVPSDPQPSTSRGFENAHASAQPSSDTNSIPVNNLFSGTKLPSPLPINSTPAIPPIPPTISIQVPSTSSALSTTPSENIEPTPNSKQLTAANEATAGNEQPTQSLAAVCQRAAQDSTDGDTNSVDTRDVHVQAEPEIASAPQVATGSTPADGGGNAANIFDMVMDETLEAADVALGSTAQPRPEPRKRKKDGAGYSTEPDTVKGFNQCLLRLLECPVCLECMEPPIAQCRRGHLVCSRCRARLTSCPVCRTAFSSVRNRAMEGVAEMVRYPCRHGCGREVVLRRRGAHEASCAARTYRCPAHPCNLRHAVPLADLLDHLQKKHTSLMKSGRTHKFSMKMNTKLHDTWLVLVDRDLFHLRIDVDIRSWGIVVYVAYIGPKCKANDFLYEVTVVGQNSERKLTYSRVTHSDLESSSLNVSRQDCFNLTLDQAINFLRIKSKNYEPDKYLDFIVQINNRETNETRVGNETP